MEITQLKDRNQEMLTRDGIQQRGERDLNALPPNPGDSLIVTNPKSRHNLEMLIIISASTQSDHNRSKQIEAFHSNRCWLEHVLSSSTITQRVCLKSFRTRTTGASRGGMGLFGNWNTYVSHQMGTAIKDESKSGDEPLLPYCFLP